MPSFGDLIDEVISTMQGHTTDVPMMGTLVGDISADSTELALDFGDNPGAGRPNGVVEIDNELLLITQFNANNGVAKVPAWGRGHSSTVPATHDAGARVTVRPRYPRKRVASVLNQVIQSTSPPLYAARDLDPIETGPFVEIGYPLPADTLRVLRVDATELPGAGPLAERRVVRDWQVREVAGQRQLVIPEWDVYQTLLVTIAAVPALLVDESDDFATTTGLPESVADLVIFGALARLVLSPELARQQVTTVEASSRNERIQAGSGTTISRYYQALFTQRLEAERDRLQDLHPIQLLRRG